MPYYLINLDVFMSFQEGYNGYSGTDRRVSGYLGKAYR